MTCDRDNRRALQAEAAAAVIELRDFAGALKRALLRTDGGRGLQREFVRELAQDEADREAEATGDRIGLLFNAAAALDAEPAEIRAYVSAHRDRPAALERAIRKMLQAYTVGMEEMREEGRKL